MYVVRRGDVRRLIAACAVLLLVSWLTGGQAQSAERLESAWNSFQRTVREAGVVFQTINTLDVLSNVSGGRQRGTTVTGDTDLVFMWDLERMHPLLDDATLFFYGLGVYGGNAEGNVGASQAVSSISAPKTWKLFEAWYQQNFFHGQVSLLGGLYDITSEFDVIQSSAELFVNSSFGTGPELAGSGRNGPSTFPTTSLALRGQGILSDSLLFRAVIADGVPGDPNDPEGTEVIIQNSDGLFWGAELAYYSLRQPTTRKDMAEIVKRKPLRVTFQRVGRAAPVQYTGKYALGLWGYTTNLNDLSERDQNGNPVQRQGTYGIYGLAERTVFQERDDPGQGLTVFARAGVADPKTNQFSQYYGGGLIYAGLFPSRDKDLMGLGVATALNGSHFTRANNRQGNPVNRAEFVVEWSYAFQVNPNIVLQPDIQYILNPGTDPTLDDALIVGMRLGMNMNWFEGSSTSVEKLK